MMAIAFDRSWNSVLVTCDDCPFWFALRLDQREAYVAAEGHQTRAHDIDARRAAEPRLLWEKRHAANP